MWRKVIKLKWEDLFQKYFNITDEHIYSNGEISTEYTVKNNTINIKAHIYEKFLDINRDFELNGVEFIEHLRDDSSNPIHYLNIECNNGDNVFFEIHSDEVFNDYSLSVSVSEDVGE